MGQNRPLNHWVWIVVHTTVVDAVDLYLDMDILTNCMRPILFAVLFPGVGERKMEYATNQNGDD